MRYFIEDTKTGFKLGYFTSGGTRVEAEVEGSHSEIANIYGQVERAFDVERRHDNVRVSGERYVRDEEDALGRRHAVPDVERALERVEEEDSQVGEDQVRNDPESLKNIDVSYDMTRPLEES